MSTTRFAALAAALVLLPASTLAAQTPAPGVVAAAAGINRWEFRITGGPFMPSGSQRVAIKSGQVTAAQLSYLIRPSLAVTGTFGWARSRDLAATGIPKLDVFTSDIGVEARPTTWFRGSRVTFSPILGIGAGARSYNYRSLDVDAAHNVAGYVAAGGELGVGRVGLRLEVRDYVTGFKPLAGAGRTATRNDVMVMVGLSFNRQPAARLEPCVSC